MNIVARPEVKTLQQFAETCEGKSPEEIYNLFEHDLCSTLRDQIYSLAEETDPEPARSGMNVLGEYYNIASLRDY
jgi:hypothetical protein